MSQAIKAVVASTATIGAASRMARTAEDESMTATVHVNCKVARRTRLYGTYTDGAVSIGMHRPQAEVVRQPQYCDSWVAVAEFFAATAGASWKLSQASRKLSPSHPMHNIPTDGPLARR